MEIMICGNRHEKITPERAINNLLSNFKGGRVSLYAAPTYSDYPRSPSGRVIIGEAANMVGDKIHLSFITLEDIYTTPSIPQPVTEEERRGRINEG